MNMNCPTCTFINSNNAERCEMCGMAFFTSSMPSSLSSSTNTNANNNTTNNNEPLSCEWLHVAQDQSQFTYGGTSACPFGTLTMGISLLEEGSALVEGKEEKKNTQIIQCLTDAIASYSIYKGLYGSVNDHSSIYDILSRMNTAQQQEEQGPFSKLILQSWSDIPEYLQRVKSNLVFPEALLPCGNIQLSNYNRTTISNLLLGFKGTHTYLTLTSMGYVCGVLCHTNGLFIICDSHSKTFERFGHEEKRGAYVIACKDYECASNVLYNFSFESVSALREHLDPSQVAQYTAATTIDIAALKLNV